MSSNRILLGTLLLLVALPAAGAEVCRLDETIGQCQERIRHQVVPPDTTAVVVAEAEAKGAKEKVERQPTGEDTGGTSLRSTTKNFLPALALSALLGAGDVADDTGDLVVDLNFLLPGGLKGTKNAQLQAVAKTEPAMADKIRESLPEASRAELAGTLEERVTAGDDWTLSFAYNLQGHDRGRDFERYRTRYRALVLPLVIDHEQRSAMSIEAVTAVMEKAKACFEEAAKHGAEVPVDLDEATFEDIALACQMSIADAAVYRAELARTITEHYSWLAKLREELTDNGLDRFAELVANQPQLHLTVARNEREPLVGPDTTSGKLTFEWSRVNLNAALAEDDCSIDLRTVDPTTSPDVAASCLAHYRDYVAAHADKIGSGERFSFALEYQETEEWAVPLTTLLPDSGVSDLRLPRAEKLIAEVGWSRTLTGLQGQPTRFDLVARYEDVSDDPTRRDRLVATATFDLEVGGLDVPLGIVYANHGEYLGEVDQQLSAHFGIKLNLRDRKE